MTIQAWMRPLAPWIHIVGWTVYLIIFIGINEPARSPARVLAIAVGGCTGVALVYIHRYLLRRAILSGHYVSGIMKILGLAVGLATLVYFVLHVWDNVLSHQIWNKEKGSNIGAFVIGYGRFHLNFIIYAMLVCTIECAVSVVKNSKILEWKKQYLHAREQRVWKEEQLLQLSRSNNAIAPHFVGNLLNRMYIWLSRGVPIGHPQMDALDRLMQYGLELYAVPDTELIPLAKEVQHLRHIAVMEPGLGIQLVLPEHVGGYKIPPLLLVSLYKNMCKHGVQGEGQEPASFVLTLRDNILEVKTSNAVASQPSWTGGEGGRGLEMLAGLLDVHFGHHAQLVYGLRQERFELLLRIDYTSSA